MKLTKQHIKDIMSESKKDIKNNILITNLLLLLIIITEFLDRVFYNWFLSILCFIFNLLITYFMLKATFIAIRENRKIKLNDLILDYKSNIKNIKKFIINQFLFTLILMILLSIILAPVYLFILPIAFLLFSGESIGLISILLFLLFFLASVVSALVSIYFTLRLIFVYHLFVDKPELAIKDVIAKSYNDTNGNVKTLVYLFIYVLGLLLIVVITFGLAIIYVAPYLYIVITRLYLLIYESDNKEINNKLEELEV